jgi:acyl-CoA synthetase (NDP forming)/GNAT superfamily N-acetyltransferase
MSSRNLEYLLAPHSVVLVGASDRPHSVGAAVMRNLLAGDFDGPVWPVNLQRAQVAGRAAFRSVADLPAVPDLAIVCTPAPTVPDVISQLGAIGTRAAVVMTAGFDVQAPGTLAQAMLDAARPHTLRILGPNCRGLLLPRIGLNASVADIRPLPGNIAFIAQSGGLDAALDWARTAQAGFSCLVSLGDCADVDFGDLLDSLCHDPHTRVILLDVETIEGARKFLSAARAAARNKPVIVVRPHLDADDVYDAAFRRAGMLRVATAREMFETAEAFLHAARYNGDQRQLMEVPSSIPDSFVPHPDAVKSVIAVALAQARSTLTGTEANAVLSAYSIPIAMSHAEAVDAKAQRPFAHELIAGIAVDPTFGPVIRFGAAIGFPPLNSVLAADLISRAHVRPPLEGFENVAPVDMRALEHTLVQVSQLAVDVAEIVGLEINPLLADERGVIALDACIRVSRADGAAADRLAIRPYPKELEETVTFDGRKVLLRPLRPEDASQHREFVSHISEPDMLARFFRALKELAADDLAYLTQIDYERAMAFIAVATAEDGQQETLGVVRVQADSDGESAEFAVLVRSDLKGQGLGSVLMEKIIRYCRQRGIRKLMGDVLATNDRMLQLASAHGFRSETVREGAVRVTLDLSLAE